MLERRVTLNIRIISGQSMDVITQLSNHVTSQGNSVQISNTFEEGIKAELEAETKSEVILADETEMTFDESTNRYETILTHLKKLLEINPTVKINLGVAEINNQFIETCLELGIAITDKEGDVIEKWDKEITGVLLLAPANICESISGIEKIKVVGKTENRNDLINKALKLKPDVMLLAYDLPKDDVEFLDLVSDIKNVKNNIRIIIYLPEAEQKKLNELVQAKLTRAGVEYVESLELDVIEERILRKAIQPEQPAPEITSKPTKSDKSEKFINPFSNPIPLKIEKIKDSIPKPQKPTVIERTITIKEDRIIGTVVIAVVGSISRVGTTNLCIALSQYLRAQGFDVALYEGHESTSFGHVRNAYEDTVANGSSFFLSGVDFYPYNQENSVLDLLEGNYNYLILDLGVYGKCNIDEFRRADVSIIVNGVTDWEIPELEEILKSLEWSKKIKYYFTLSDDERFEFIKSNMDHLACYKAPFNPNPFKNTAESQELFQELLKEVLPGKIIEKKTKGNGVLQQVKTVLAKLIKRGGQNEE